MLKQASSQDMDLVICHFGIFLLYTVFLTRLVVIILYLSWRILFFLVVIGVDVQIDFNILAIVQIFGI